MPYPPVGTLIDSGQLQLLSVIGTGGYGVVYQAIDLDSSAHYAVKCLIRAQVQRQAYIQEITLHQLASAHPGIATLYRITEDDEYAYMIMDYAPDQDLFVQILHKCRFLGHNELIKSVFLQLLDAVEHCHSLGIYHRDLKPENILCFDNGRRITLTDFGLATTQGMSTELKTGSIFHMSPECQIGDLDFEGVYSPRYCDIWSLGIVLLNIVTGRNPWKCATHEDPTFRAYCRNPYECLPKILPISTELNDVLVMMLSVEWRARSSISDIRAAISQVNSFYSVDTIFEGNVARCSWEAGIDLGTPAQPCHPNIRPQHPKRKTRNGTLSSGSSAIADLATRLESISSSDIFGEDDADTQYLSCHIISSSAPRPKTLSYNPSRTTSSSISSLLDEPWAPRSRSSFSSLVSSLRSLFRLCSSSSLLHGDKDRITPDPEMCTIDF